MSGSCRSSHSSRGGWCGERGEVLGHSSPGLRIQLNLKAVAALRFAIEILRSATDVLGVLQLKVQVRVKSAGSLNIHLHMDMHICKWECFCFSFAFIVSVIRPAVG